MNAQNDITVIFADDHEMTVAGFYHSFHGNGLNVLAIAYDGAELLQKTRELQPQVVVTDYRMPKMKGTEVSAIIKKEFPAINVLAFTAYDDLATIKQLRAAGVRGIAIKTASREDLLRGIIAVSKGEEFYCTAITNMLMSYLVEPPPPHIDLTRREAEVMGLLKVGLSNKEVANFLGIKTRTVEDHRASLYKKTGTNNLVQLSLFAERWEAWMHRINLDDYITPSPEQRITPPPDHDITK